MGFRIEVRHPSLRRVRVFEGSDPFLVQQEALAQGEAWEPLWRLSQEDPAVQEPGGTTDPARDGRRPSADTSSEDRETADALTMDAQRELRRIGRILSAPASLSSAMESEPMAFTEPPPEPPPLPDPVPRPSPEQARFRPRLRFIDRLLPPLRRRREEEATERFERAWKVWHREEERVRRALLAHQAEFEAWDRRRMDFEAERRARSSLKRQGQAAVKGEGKPGEGPSGLLDRLRDLLLSAHDSALVPPNYRLDFEGGSGHVRVVQRLPALEDLPTLERVVFREEQGDFLEEHLSPEERAVAFDSVVYQSVLRTFRVLFESDEKESLNTVRVDGWVQCHLPTTGRAGRLALLSLTTSPDQFLSLDLDRVQPRACFDGLGGLRRGEPHELTPLDPGGGGARTSEVEILQEEGRLARDRLPRRQRQPARTPTDLATLTPAEFRSLMMGILRTEFSGGGSEIRLTVTERDGSLEAVTLPTGTERKAGVVIHVRRASTPLEAGPLHRLQRRVTDEGAIGGVLLTLGEVSPGTLDSVKGHPLRVLDGEAVGKMVTRYFSRADPPAYGASGGLDLPGLATPQ